MSGIEEPPDSVPTPSPSPAEETVWPARDFETTHSWDVKASGNRRRPTAAEQAVPWLIGLVLALAGMLIVLLALIFSSNEGLLPAYGAASPSPTPGETATPRPTPTPEPSAEPSPSVAATPIPEPTPAFPPLEIVFMQRTSEAGPIHLFSHDFAGSAALVPQARDNRGVSTYDWAPSGAYGLAVVAGNPLALTPGNSARDLGDGFDAVTFAPDSDTAYAIRATLAGANDRAELLRMDYSSGAVASLHTWVYPHPTTFQEDVVSEAQFADDGGFERVYVLENGTVIVWILGAPQVYSFDPVSGVASTTDHMPFLWSPNGTLRIAVTESGSNSRFSVRGIAGEERGALNVTGRVSHVRWSTASNQIVFTLTRATSSGGVAQDLYVWDLVTGHAGVRLTQDLRSMGGEYRGSPDRWRL
ncbi:MAG TPA: hypothetical protein VGO32_00605 [Candidatus Limnocylindria bacterium]|nr:hypothetical protein [Candidatus Limnocylindria bacterium]